VGEILVSLRVVPALSSPGGELDDARRRTIDEFKAITKYL
jgi:hypothetical protein